MLFRMAAQQLFELRRRDRRAEQKSLRGVAVLGAEQRELLLAREVDHRAALTRAAGHGQER